jgi:hypothetical protein
VAAVAGSRHLAAFPIRNACDLNFCDGKTTKDGEGRYS